MSQQRSTAADLLRDDRGVIMVTGVIFSMCLIGCAWFITGIGNAIAYRENLQNAADSAAFASAIYDARGMNLLAMINIIMAITAALLVAGKIAEGIAILSALSPCNDAIKAAKDCCENPACDVFTVGLGCIGLCGVALATCTAKCSKIGDYQSDMNKADKAIHVALEVEHDLEVGLAVAWPWVAAGKATNMQPYYPGVGGNGLVGVAATTSFSYSQIPWGLDAHTGTFLTGPTSAGTATQPPPPANGTRYGLPVQSDTYADLCNVSLHDISNLGGIVPSGNAISGAIGSVLDGFAQWLCDDETKVTGLSVAATDVVETIPFIADPYASMFCAIEGDITSPSKIKGLFSAGSFASGAGELLESQTTFVMSDNGVSGADGTPTPSGVGHGGVKSDTYTYSPMMLFPPATMGLDYFGVWSTSIGNYDDTLTSARVQIAGQQAGSGNKVVAPPPLDRAVAVAKSEFYYDPNTTDNIDKETKISTDPAVVDNVLWNMRWRARLRRYHYFPGMAGQIDNIITNLFDPGLSSVVSTIIGGIENGESPSDAIFGQDGVSAISVNQLPTVASVPLYH